MNKQSISSFSLRSPIKAALMFTFLSFLPSAIGLILLPVYLRYLDAASYGTLAILGLFGGFYGVVANLQLNVATTVNYYDHVNDPAKLKKYISSIYTASTLISTVTFILFLGFGQLFFEYIIKSDEIDFFPYGMIVLGSAYLTQLTTIYFVVLKNEYLLKEFFIYSTALILLNIGFQYYLIVVKEMGVMGSIVGTLVSKTVVIGTMLFIKRSLIDFHPNVGMIKESLKFSIPFIPVIFMNWFYTVGDRFFLEHFLDLTEVGRYAVVINMLLIANQIFNALADGFRPYLFNCFKNISGNNLTIIRKFIGWHIKIGLFTLSGLILVGSNLDILTTNEKYISTMPLFTLGAFIMVPKLLLRISYLQLMFRKQSKAISWFTFLSMSILILSFLFLIPIFKLKGALYAIGISNFFNLALFYYRGQKELPIPMQKLKYSAIIIGTMVLVAGSGFLCDHFSFTLSTYGIVQFTGVTIFLVLFSIEELQSIYKYQLNYAKLKL